MAHRTTNTIPAATHEHGGRYRGLPVIVTDASAGTTRISFAIASRLTGVITPGRFDFMLTHLGTSQFVLRHVELLDLDQLSFLANASALQYPVVIK